MEDSLTGGVRIHHQSRRDCTVEVPHPGRPVVYTHPDGRIERRCKLYRIDVDHDGDAIVSAVVLHRLLEAFALLQLAPTFVVLNEVRRPPDIVIDLSNPQVRPTYRES